MEENKVSRRRFLQVSAAGAAGAVLVACGGTAEAPAAPTQAPAAAATEAPAAAATEAPAAAATEAPAAAATEAPAAAATEAPAAAATEAPAAAAPGSYQESPVLAQMVKDGKLPPIEERLPKNPYVVPHAWVKQGKYGGTLQWSNSWGGDGVSTIVQESMYGHSPLRWLKDGLEIGPGLVESWEANADASEWTFHFREGLKWSDGKPWTTADIMYWWDDLVLNEEHSDVPPDEGRSGTGTLAKFTTPDETTLIMTFDAPAPLTADRLAMWVNAGIGPRWMAPRHYLEQFHPKYNTTVKDFVDHDLKMQFKINPDCPTMTGWKCISYKEGSTAAYDRNPFYWCVTKEGDQLPYIDKINVTGYQDPEVEKVNMQAGKVDFTHHWGFGLTDVSSMKAAEPTSKAIVRFWDSGSGSGQSFFFNYDLKEEKMRALIREPKFRQALSLAVNRDEVQKNFYFNTGEKTTGTFSPKAIEYNFNDEAKQRYAEWRDSYVAYDPEKAKALLDEIGVKAGSNGVRTMADGTPFKVEAVYSATAGKDVVSQNELMIRDWKAIGLDATLVPLPPEGRGEKWRAGELQSNADWGIGDGPNHLVFPQWLVPIEAERWAPLEGKFYELRGTEKVDANLQEIAEKDTNPWERQPPRLEADPGGAVEKLWKIYDQSKIEPDALKRHALVWDMMKIHVSDGPFVQGSVANFRRPFLVKEGLTNVPTIDDLALGGFTDPWIHPTPAVYDPESWFWENPEAHA